MIVKKVFRIVNYCGEKYVTAFAYDENNQVVDSWFWEYWQTDVDGYAEWVKEHWQEDGVETIFERVDKLTK